MRLPAGPRRRRGAGARLRSAGIPQTLQYPSSIWPVQPGCVHASRVTTVSPSRVDSSAADGAEHRTACWYSSTRRRAERDVARRRPQQVPRRLVRHRQDRVLGEPGARGPGPVGAEQAAQVVTRRQRCTVRVLGFLERPSAPVESARRTRRAARGLRPSSRRRRSPPPVRPVAARARMRPGPRARAVRRSSRGSVRPAPTRTRSAATSSAYRCWYSANRCAVDARRLASLMRSRSRRVTATSTSSTVARISSRTPPATAAFEARRLHVERGRVDAEHLHLPTAPLDRGAHGQDPVGDAGAADRVGGQRRVQAIGESGHERARLGERERGRRAERIGEPAPHQLRQHRALVGADPPAVLGDDQLVVAGVDRLAHRHGQRDLGGVHVGTRRQLGGGVELVERVPERRPPSDRGPRGTPGPRDRSRGRSGSRAVRGAWASRRAAGRRSWSTSRRPPVDRGRRRGHRAGRLQPRAVHLGPRAVGAQSASTPFTKRTNSGWVFATPSPYGSLVSAPPTILAYGSCATKPASTVSSPVTESTLPCWNSTMQSEMSSTGTTITLG